ncbi:MAG: hypothetical protein LQ351_004186 [Letrouitia transgressa]|nr:MAG: hypothetical protein LQ351_004186 [Letrouitia transgressa]
MSSTTPRGLPIRTPASVGQTLSPSLSGRTRSPSRDPQISSPSYFGFVIDPGSNPTDASPGRARKNWASSAAAPRSAAVASPRGPPPDSPQRFEAFLKQSESNTFHLSHGNLAHFSANAASRQSSSSNSLDGLQDRKEEQNSPRPKKRPSLEEEQDPESPEHMDTDTSAPQRKSLKSDGFPTVQLFDAPDVQSPVSASSSDLSQLGRTQISHIDERHPRNSLPHNRIDPPSSMLHHIHRAETLPDSLTADGPSMISPQDFVNLLEGNDSGSILLLDLRVFPQYSKSRILGALNLCIPTTLLKRPSFNVQKLAETFTKIHEREKFDGWRQARYIIVYDVSSTQLKDATSCVNILKKFISEGYEGSTLVLRGGFAGFSGSYRQFLDHDLGTEVESSKKLSIDPTRPGTAPVAGGCLMPATQTAANPFFGNIRQNMDLADGVGQMSVAKPSALNAKGVSELPSWLRAASDEADNGRTVADKFLSIEIAEQRRMQKALSTNVSYSSSTPKPMGEVQIAGIEKGLKNRYKDMLPYDHSRVRLQNVPPGDCDYVNASHLKAEYSSKHYIASQAPVPATFEASISF